MTRFHLVRASLLLVPLLLAAAPVRADEAGAPDYPETRTVDAYDELHGVRVPDPYRWLEEDDAPEVVEWDRAQMALLRERLDGLPYREAVRRRIAEEFDLGNMRSAPTFAGGRRWFTRRPKGADHSILYVTDEAGRSEPRVVLDPNGWSEDGTASMVAWVVSPDGSYVAYRRDEKGSEETTLFVRDVVTGEDLPDRITRTKFSPVVWSPDSRGFFYTRLPDPESVPEGEGQYHRRLRYHRLGTLPVDDPIVYGRGRPAIESAWVYESSDREHVFVARGLPYEAIDTFEIHPEGDDFRLAPVIVGSDSRTYVDRVGSRYVLNSDRDRPERAIYVAQRIDGGALGSWRPRFAGVQGVFQDALVVESKILAHVRDDLVSRLYLEPVEGGAVAEIELPGPGTVGTIRHKPGDPRIWFTFQSYSEPPTLYEVDTTGPKFPLQRLERLETTVDVEGLVSERHTYASKDGTQIPLFLVRRKDTPLDGSAPTVLYGYGGFRVGLYPYYSRAIGLWTELGGVWAVASLRGGDEYGEDWHEAGMLGEKQNVFDDFIAGADWLVEQGFADRERLAIQGGSNGGLLVAAVLNQRPDLVGAAISGVPLTDMLRYHRFQYAKTWTREYGDPDVEEHFGWLRAYSPYHNVAEAAFPAVLVTAGLHDGRVDPFHARKIVARWQAATTAGDPILLYVDRDSGHGAASVSHYEKELLDRFTFLFSELGAAPRVSKVGSDPENASGAGAADPEQRGPGRPSPR